MYAKYAYVAGATQADIIADLVAILTGATDKNTLSAACDKPNTEIVTAYAPAGWQLHDAAAGTAKQCLKAPCAGDANQFKYVTIGAPNATYLHLGLYETWNAGTHVGTNAAFNSDTNQTSVRLDVTNGGEVHLAATARYLFAVTQCSYGLGSEKVFEVDRNLGFFGVGSGYLPACLQHNALDQMYFCRAQDGDGVLRTTNQCYAAMKLPGMASVVNQTAALPANGVMNSQGRRQLILVPVSFNTNATGVIFAGGISATGILASAGLNAFDTVVDIQGRTLVGIPIGGSSSVYASYLVPRG